MKVTTVPVGRWSSNAPAGDPGTKGAGQDLGTGFGLETFPRGGWRHSCLVVARCRRGSRGGRNAVTGDAAGASCPPLISHVELDGVARVREGQVNVILTSLIA